MKIAIGAVVAGLTLKEKLKKFLEEKLKIEVIDLGVYSADQFVHYTDVARKMAAIIQSGKVERGILICGTGMGMALAANKYRGILAACCESIYSAQTSRIYNNTNVLTLGEFIVGPQMAAQMAEIWLKTDFGAAPVANKVRKTWRKMADEIERLGEKAK